MSFEQVQPWLIPIGLLVAVFIACMPARDQNKPGNPYLLPSVILGACILGAAYFVSTRPPAPRQPQEIHIRHSNGLPGGSFNGR